MGLEAECTLRRGRRGIAGRAQLETDFLLFRGEESREKVLLAQVTAAAVEGEDLVLHHGDARTVLRFEQGVAAKWATKILHSPSLLDKLGVKDGMQVVVLGVRDDAFLTQLAQRVGTYRKRAAAGSDLVFLAAESSEALDRLPALRKTLVPNGAIWVVHRKGKGAALKDTMVFAAARGAGLVDTKVASFSATHTAERLVMPRAKR
ncbi:MAG: DUF3052 domain-containing protein [Gemmatimonadaceae bacterium]